MQKKVFSGHSALGFLGKKSPRPNMPAKHTDLKVQGDKRSENPRPCLKNKLIGHAAFRRVSQRLETVFMTHPGDRATRPLIHE